MSDSEYLKALEIQRRNFEAQFGSLETLGYEDKSKIAQVEDENEDKEENEEDAFEGFGSEESDDEENIHISSASDSEMSEVESEVEEVEEKVVPKVVRLNDSYSNMGPTPRANKKLLGSGRVPTLTEIAAKEQELSKLSKKQLAQGKKEDDENLENDLKLQRLLLESHILANAVEYSGADVTLKTLDFDDPIGKARRRALDSRIRKISSINSASGGLPKTLEKMPMAMRKGMIRSREMKVARYEQEAKDAGIVLSKLRKGELRDLNAGKGSTLTSDRIGTGKKIVTRVRDMGLKINSVGRSTRNGLVIAQTDIDRINSKGKRFNKKKGGKR
jgi:AAA ATPase containing von Willebrand factor type A (vWA) domain